MKKVAELRQERQAKIDAQKKIVDDAVNDKGEARSLNTEESAKFKTIQSEIEDLNEAIRMAEQFEENQRAAAAARSTPVAGAAASTGEEAEKEKIEKRFSLVKAIREATPGNGGLTGVEKEIHEIGKQEMRNANVRDAAALAANLSLPLSTFTRATQQTVTQDSGEYGAAMVQNQAPRMVDPLRPKLIFEDLGAVFMTGLTGGDIPMVVDNDFTMEWAAETAAVVPQKKKYAGPVLSPKRAAGAVDISNQLLLQSSIDVDNRVATGLRNGFAQLLHSAIINGAGGVAPTGILNTTGVLDALATTAELPDWAKIVELQGLIESANATDESLGYVLHPKLKALLKTVKKDAGSGRFLLEGNEIDGVKYVSSSLVPVLDDNGTDVYPLIYGDFAQMNVGQWGSVNITINPYSADVANSVRLVLNTYADMQIANPAAFAKNSFFKLS